jgi:hypothetical protein
MKRKIYNTKFLIFLLLVVIFSVSYPIINLKYIEPRKYKKDLSELLKARGFLNASDAQIDSFSECLIGKLLKNYKSIENVPQWKDFGLEEKKLAMNCIMDNFITDSLDKQIFKGNYDSIMIKIWK